MGKNLKTPVGIRLSDAELVLLSRAAKRFGGNKTKAVVEGLKAVCGDNELSKALILAEIDRRMK